MRCTKLKLIGYILLTVLVTISPAQAADDLDQIDNLSQLEFELLSKDLGSALAYRAVSPAESLGITGFDIGISVTATQLEHTEVWEIALDDSDIPSTLYLPKLYVAKGLPFGIDVGVFYTSVPDSNIQLWGGEAKYAIWEGGTATPALAIRGSYTRLKGVDQLVFSTMGLDLSISKGFAMLTPYAGIGIQQVESEPQEDAALVLQDESFNQNRAFAGLNINFLLLNTALELDRTGDATSYSFKVGLKF